MNSTNTSLFIILSKLPTLNLPIKKPPFIKVAIFSDVILVLNIHYMINIYKTIKPSHFEELHMIQNNNNLMFHVIFMFSN